VGRELAALLARWWIATGRYSEAGQFLTTAAGVPAAAAPGIQARVLLGAAWSAFHLGDNPLAAPLAADGVACARQASEPQLEVWGRNLLAGLAWHAGDADRIVAEIEASRVLSGRADPALAARAQALLAAAALLSSDLAEQERRGLLAIELARTAAGQEGLVLALTMWSMSALAGAGIQPATVAALDEAANVLAAHPDRFTETIMHQCRAELFATLGQLEAAETEVGLCWAAGRGGAVRLMEFVGPLAEARLAAARGDTAAAAGALRRAADGGRRVASVMFVPAALAGLACMAASAGDQSTAAATAGEARAELGGRRQAITAALGYAEGVMAWHRGGTDPRRRGDLRRPQRRRPQTTRHRLGQPDPSRTGGRPPRRRRPAERRHRPAAVHRPWHRQGAPVPHLRQARHHHPRRTGRTGSLTGPDRQMIWRARHVPLSRRDTRSHRRQSAVAQNRQSACHRPGNRHRNQAAPSRRSGCMTAQPTSLSVVILPLASCMVRRSAWPAGCDLGERSSAQRWMEDSWSGWVAGSIPAGSIQRLTSGNARLSMLTREERAANAGRSGHAFCRCVMSGRGTGP
jgi:hypothetical protein